MSQVSRDPIIKLSNFMNQELKLNFLGGRVIYGKLVGLDNLNNLVQDDAIEHLRDSKDPYKQTGKTRDLSFIVVRGTMIQTITPTNGIEIIDNPYLDKAAE